MLATLVSVWRRHQEKQGYGHSLPASSTAPPAVSISAYGHNFLIEQEKNPCINPDASLLPTQLIEKTNYSTKT
jgi:hypothetical protein